MKKLFIFIILGLIFTNCSHKSKCDDSFETFFNEKLNQIIKYDSITQLGDPIPTELWMEFYENAGYLHLLTGHEFRFDRTEPPGYPSRKQLELDINDLKAWYHQHGKDMSIQTADSIVQSF